MNKKRTDLTAEIAETAEFLSTRAWNKDIFFIGSGLSGAASLLFAFLCVLSDLRGEYRLFLTAEHAETAEGKKYNAFLVSGASQSIICFSLRSPAISAVNYYGLNYLIYDKFNLGCQNI